MADGPATSIRLFPRLPSLKRTADSRAQGLQPWMRSTRVDRRGLVGDAVANDYHRLTPNRGMECVISRCYRSLQRRLRSMEDQRPIKTADGGSIPSACSEISPASFVCRRLKNRMRHLRALGARNRRNGDPRAMEPEKRGADSHFGHGSNRSVLSMHCAHPRSHGSSVSLQAPDLQLRSI